MNYIFDFNRFLNKVYDEQCKIIINNNFDKQTNKNMIDLTNANETATQNNQPDSTHQEPSNCQPIVNLFVSETEYQEN